MSLLSEARVKAQKDKQARVDAARNEEQAKRDKWAQNLSELYASEVTYLDRESITTLVHHYSNWPGGDRDEVKTATYRTFMVEDEIKLALVESESGRIANAHVVLPCAKGCGRPAMAQNHVWIWTFKENATDEERREKFVAEVAKVLVSPPVCGICQGQERDARCQSCGRGWS